MPLRVPAIARVAHGRTGSRKRGWREKRGGKAIDCSTHLVEDLFRGIGQSNRLFKVVADLAHLLALGPVVEGAGHVDLFGSVRPVQS